MAGFNFKQKKSRTSKHFKYEDSPDRDPGEPDVIAMIKKMQQQLVFLERKIDMLISQSSSKPSRLDGHSGRYGSKTRDDSSRERSSYKGQKPFSYKRKSRP